MCEGKNALKNFMANVKFAIKFFNALWEGFLKGKKKRGCFSQLLFFFGGLIPFQIIIIFIVLLIS